jgi:electron transfer flavoprotein-quinone oxidoreductase
VIAADGVNSLLLKKAGLHREIKTTSVALAVKEVIALPKNVIEDRFRLNGNEGATIEFMGKVSKGMVGVGFIYTNKESVSFGMGCLVADYVKHKIKPYELLDEIKDHPAIAPLLAGGEVKEYMAHLIPEGGYKQIPPLYGENILVAGDAAMLVNGIHREGSNLAMISGKLAAETIIRAREYGEYSARSLAYYQQLLENSFIIPDLKKYKDTMSYLEHNRQFLDLYPDILSDAAAEMITVDGVPKRAKQWKILKNVLNKRNPFGLAADMIGMGRRMI